VPLGLRVGVLAPFVGGDHYGTIIDGVCAAVAADGGSLLAVQTLNPGARSADHSGTPALRHPVGWQHFDAAIVVGRAMGPDDVRRLQRAGKHLVSISHAFAGVTCPLVAADNRSGIRDAVRHLVEHGHQRIAFAGFMGQQDIRERRLGYVEAIAEAGLTATPDLLFNAPDNDESGGRAIGRHLLRLAERDGGTLPATALLVGTDRNAIGALEVLEAAGIAVPGDLALVGFDDIIEAAQLRPSLATVRQPLGELGAAGFAQLSALVQGTVAADAVTRVMTTFVPRETCGCLPQGPGGPGDGRTPARDWFHDTLLLQQAVNTQYELGVELLSSHQRDPRAMAWLGRTAAVAGHLGLWPAPAESGPAAGRGADGAADDDPADDDETSAELRAAELRAAKILAAADVRTGIDAATAGNRANEPLPDRPIEVVGTYPADTRTAGGGPLVLPVSAFPPASLFASSDPASGTIVRVVPVRSDGQDWGVVAIVDRTQSLTPPGREMVNNAASLLSVALDHEAVLRSLKVQKEQLHRAALFDPLTGLPNRTLLLDRLRQSAHRAARRPDRQFALLFLDLNGFKGINDTLGHAAGDRLLVEVARRLTTLLRRTDTAARMGGDEFVVLLDGLRNPQEAALAAQRLHTRLTAPIDINGQPVTVGVSIGVSRSDEGSLDVDELLRRADSAMYRAKLESRSRPPQPV